MSPGSGEFVLMKIIKSFTVRDRGVGMKSLVYSSYWTKAKIKDKYFDG